jgi:signal transduction histidine kinase
MSPSITLKSYVERKPVWRSISPVVRDLVIIVSLTVLVCLAAVWLGLLDGLLAWLHDQPASAVEALLGVLCILPLVLAIVSLRRWWALRGVLRDREAAEGHLIEAARLDGVRLAARTMQHQINNQLGVTIGYAELLAEDSSLSPEQREMALLALHGAECSVALLEQLRTLTRVDVLHVGAPDGPILAVGACQPAGDAAAHNGDRLRSR